ncbi:MAG: sigma-54 dependent transcriptional regulator [Proteobacteria bacterium]|nr:sigma-54 dependent transcriptional regulator [Pseudomonadota bacterium]
MKSILIISVNKAAIQGIRDRLGTKYRIDAAHDPVEGLDKFRRKRQDITFIDLDMLQATSSRGGPPDISEALHPFRQTFPAADIVVLSSQPRIREAVDAVKAGASTYLTFPLDPVEVDHVTESLSQIKKMESELEHLRQDAWPVSLQEGARTNSPVMKEVLGKVRSVAPTKTTVLLTGETGSGKGVLARLIHAWSNRAGGPFIAVHCGAVPDTLLESEFFGHEKGAFTGAVRRKLGKFQIADSGTLFLDEIGTISPAAQVKMLQVLQERTFSRVGGEDTIEVDIRLVAATNMDLKQLCQEGRFREDLFFRLNVFPIEVPPLRERTEDIPLLLATFLDQLNRVHKKDIKTATPEVIEALRRYAWPGNIRELENLIERAYILSSGALLRKEGFPSEIFNFEPGSETAAGQEMPTLHQVRQEALDKVELSYLRDILARCQGRINKAAQIAGMTTRQLHNLMTKHGMRKEDYK